MDNVKPLVPDADGGSTAAHPGYSGEGRADEAGSLCVVLRADAGRTQGTGHVMRLLTLAEALRERGHRAILATAEIDGPWLAAAVRATGVDVLPAPRDEIDVEALRDLGADWVVVDSYLVPAADVSALSDTVPVLLLADGDTRGAQVSLYLDQNLGAPPLAGVGEGAQLRGPAFALVRRAVRDQAPEDPVPLRHDPPRVVVVLGGTDPDDRTVDVARALALLALRADVTLVAPERQHAALSDLRPETSGWRVLAPTPDLPALLGSADVIVSAGGPSAWDVATIAIPSVLLAVVDNQRASLAAAVDSGVALGFDVVADPPDHAELARAVEALIEDPALRARLVAACRERFDGRGAQRVVTELERRRQTRAPARRP
jgi:spore coat polysaccharide biosynthesis predicted glycosyltransferase SpsG